MPALSPDVPVYQPFMFSGFHYNRPVLAQTEGHSLLFEFLPLRPPAYLGCSIIHPASILLGVDSNLLYCYDIPINYSMKNFSQSNV
jgi:hypothetical protein